MSMLRCRNLLKRVPDRYIYLSKLLVLSTSFHALFLLIVLSTYQYQNPNRLSIVVNRRIDFAIVKLLPMIKSVPDGVTSLTQLQKSTTMPKNTQVSPKKKVAPKAVAPKRQPPQKKPQPSKTTFAKKDDKPTPKPLVKQVQKKTVQPVSNSKSFSTQKNVSNAPLVPEMHKQEEIICLGRNDIALLELHNLIEQEVQKSWHPPVGLSKDLACIIKVKIDTKGNVIDLIVEESSHVISYDISARTALSSMTFPKALWGKEVAITFKQ